MRKITYTIDDREYFKRLYADTENLDAILDDAEPFKATYILEGNENASFPDRYTLLDADGNKLNINDMNGYQRGVVLNECVRFWKGVRDFHEPHFNMPCGCIHIVETNGNKTVQWE